MHKKQCLRTHDSTHRKPAPKSQKATRAGPVFVSVSAVSHVFSATRARAKPRSLPPPPPAPSNMDEKEIEMELDRVLRRAAQDGSVD